MPSLHSVQVLPAPVHTLQPVSHVRHIVCEYVASAYVPAGHEVVQAPLRMTSVAEVHTLHCVGLIHCLHPAPQGSQLPALL